ncbi:YoaK family protein [Acidiphilium angustum]|uniref:YoaK family protein n=1 Tax=Acidiphilium angustum TaxID=523 RepID=UPI000493F8C7|nr:YoaK family protein [Acidiphilium angustum]
MTILISEGTKASILFGLISGSCDGTTYIALHKMLAANIIGDLLLIGLDWAKPHHHGMLGRLLAAPVFVFCVWLARLAAGKMRRHGLPAIRGMMLTVVVLLSVFMVLGLTLRPFPAQDSPNTLIVGMIGVAAMATLNVIARMWPVLTAHTTAMTGNSVRLMLDLAELILKERQKEPKLLHDSGRLGLTVLCFVAGGALAALVYVKAGLWCIVLPFVFAIWLTAQWPKEPERQT